MNLEGLKLPFLERFTKKATRYFWLFIEPPLLQKFLDQTKSAAGSWMAETQIPAIQTQQMWKYLG